MSSSRRTSYATASDSSSADSFDVKARQDFERYRQHAFHQSFGRGGNSPNPSPRAQPRPLTRRRYGAAINVEDEVPEATWDSASADEDDSEHEGAYPYGAYPQSQHPPQHRMLSEVVGRETNRHGMCSSPVILHGPSDSCLSSHISPSDFVHVSEYYYAQTSSPTSSQSHASFSSSNYSTPASSAPSYGSYHPMDEEAQYSLGHGLGLAVSGNASCWQPSHRDDGSSTMHMHSTSNPSKPQQPDTVIYIMESQW